MNYILGAKNKTTNGYENIYYVDKANKYQCICCDSDLILRKGEKRFQSFVHKTKNGCTYFKNPSQEQLIHDAKLHLQKILEENRINIYRKCRFCLMSTRLQLQKAERVIVGEEVIVENECGEQVYKYKIYGEKQTEVIDDDDNRFHINMLGLIHTIVHNISTRNIELVCGKKFCCEKCKKYEQYE